MTEAEGFPPAPEDPPVAAVLGELTVTADLTVTPAEPVKDGDGE